MIAGLYLSATGVMTNSYRQDIIANNLANSETDGFKRDLAMFQERRTAAQEFGLGSNATNAMLEKMGGGVITSPTEVDTSQGDIEPADSPLDMAIEGNGFFQVNDNGETRLTRNGRFAINHVGHLSMESNDAQEVLDVKGRPISIDSSQSIAVNKQGEITQNGALVGQIALVDVADRGKLQKRGGTLLAYSGDLTAASGSVHDNFIERSNVDSATELAALMDTQRQLEANANMIQTQDATLARLVNDVGKIS